MDSRTQQEQFQKKVNEAPNNKLFRFSLAKSLFDQNNFKASIPHLKVCIRLQPDWMQAHILLGKALLEIKNSEEAQAILEQALQLAIEQNHEDPKSELLGLLQLEEKNKPCP
ncbi:MAG: molecular chaperone DnaJ [Puniceicoccaceae bacterium]|nr:MAG: molecular chaperone DnaJ [Puniceicoccaceae bacterium]